jgi:hypothetical protein
MNPRISVFVGLVGVFAVGSAAVASCPATPVTSDVNGETGHYFEVYAAPAISWDEASACAVSKSNSGVVGHLATITSSSEDGWVDNLRNSSGLGQTWLGGSQLGPVEPRGGWQWINNEGPFPGVNTDTGYANWHDAEPNNTGDVVNNTGGIENHLTMGLWGLGGGWNDAAFTPGLIDGFIVEYDLPRPAACVGTSCETISGQVLVIPPEWIDNKDDTIKFSSYEFRDPRVAKKTCGSEPLNLFEYLGPSKTLRIPPYLCGSPNLVVVAVDGKDLSFTKGAVLIENDTKTVLPDNDPHVCKDTKGPILPTAGEDPQGQDVVVYQTTDPARMLEDLPGNRGQYPQFAGAAGEFTNSCGSSRGSGKETSYFVVGMHVDFGAMGSTPAGSKDSFVRLTRYKLTLLQQSVVAAKSAGALKPGVSVVMDALVRLAIYSLDRGNPAGALVFVKQFLKLVDAVSYTPVPDNNYNGEHLMRGRNIEFTLRVKVIPPIGP